MKLKLPTKLRTDKLAEFLILFPLWGSWLPGAAAYLLDIVWILLLMGLLRFWKNLHTERVSGIALWILLFLGMTGLVCLVQRQPVMFYLWGLRNNFRFYAAFFSYALFLNGRDVESLWRRFDRLFWINFLLTLVQFVLFRLRGDYLGGLFGTQQGCNGYTNLFLVIMVTKYVVFYLEGMNSWDRCLSVCAVALLTAALAELKFFFVEFALVVCLAILWARGSQRKYLLVLAGLVGAVCCAMLLYRLFPEFGGWFHPSAMLKTATADVGYASAGDLNRLTAIADLNQKFFESPWQRLFGLGLGSCDHSGFSFLTTRFYQVYEGLHYTWMSHAFLYLETGYLGLLYFFGFFLITAVTARRREGQAGPRWRAYCRVSRILAVVCMLVGLYNASLRSEAGYYVYFVLAMPFGRGLDGKNTETKCAL